MSENKNIDGIEKLIGEVPDVVSRAEKDGAKIVAISNLFNEQSLPVLLGAVLFLLTFVIFYFIFVSKESDWTTFTVAGGLSALLSLAGAITLYKWLNPHERAKRKLREKQDLERMELEHAQNQQHLIAEVHKENLSISEGHQKFIDSQIAAAQKIAQLPSGENKAVISSFNNEVLEDYFSRKNALERPKAEVKSVKTEHKAKPQEFEFDSENEPPRMSLGSSQKNKDSIESKKKTPPQLEDGKKEEN